MLDNGAFEGELVRTRDLIKLASDMQPTVVVMPDKLCDSVITDYLTDTFMDLWGDYVGSSVSTSLMKVLHYADTLEFLITAQKLNPAIWVGVPKWHGGRADMLEHLQKLKCLPDLHYWALGSNGIAELEQLAKIPQIVGCDSQKPWVQGNRSSSNIRYSLQKWDNACRPSKSDQ